MFLFDVFKNWQIVLKRVPGGLYSSGGQSNTEVFLAVEQCCKPCILAQQHVRYSRVSILQRSETKVLTVKPDARTLEAMESDAETRYSKATLITTPMREAAAASKTASRQAETQVL